VGLLLCLAGVWHLEGARAGLSIMPLDVGSTPAVYRRAGGAKAPAVIIAHGFAGSRQLMEAYALNTRAGWLRRRLLRFRRARPQSNADVG